MILTAAIAFPPLSHWAYIWVSLTWSRMSSMWSRREPEALFGGETWECLEGSDFGETESCIFKLSELRAKGQWEDPEFPARHRSIEGDVEKNETEDKEIRATTAPGKCRCGETKARSVVVLDTPNKGREYYHCARRLCGCFEWCDGGASVAARRRNLTWTRALGLKLVTDYGFSCTDATQGKLGDCWFLSALCVVAQRSYDLLGRLFVETNRDAAYGVRLFLDGRWETVFVDELLPATNRDDAATLAFVKSFCSVSGEQTLWASVLEKAYAKAHGSYAALSGGQISEALEALTGAATVSIQLPDSFQELDALFPVLQRWKQVEQLPMGCGTEPQTAVGLRGSHAYAILAVKQYPEGRLVWVRDPHGVSQFPRLGSVGEAVAKRLVRGVSSTLSDDCERALVQTTASSDGSFFMDYANFAAAFSQIDVALAWRDGNNSRSFEAAFPISRARSRVCRLAVKLVNPSNSKVGLVAASAIQPTKRGAWCRDDRKKSYKLGDISLVAEVDGVVAGASICGAEVGELSSSVIFELRPGARCTIYCYSLVKNPSAAIDKTAGQPFFVRIDANITLRYKTTRCVAGAVAALHDALEKGPCLCPLLPTPSADRASRVLPVADYVDCLIRISDGLCAIIARNTSAHEAVHLEAIVFAKSAVARAHDHDPVLSGDIDAAKAYAVGVGPEPQHFRWPAKWRRFATIKTVPPASRQILLIVVRSGVQWRLGDVHCNLLDHRPTRHQVTLDAWASKSASPSAGVEAVFTPFPMRVVPALTSPPSSRKRTRNENHLLFEEYQLHQALQLSILEQGPNSSPHVFGDVKATAQEQDDAQLEAALELSRREAQRTAQLGGHCKAAAEPQRCNQEIALSRRGL